MSLITKSDCVSVANLNHTVRHICYVVDVCSNLLKDFHKNCLFIMFDQIVVGIVFSCFWLKNYKKHSFALQHDQYAVLLLRRVTQITKKNNLNAQQGSQHDCKIPQKKIEKLRIKLSFQAFFAFVYPNYGIWDQASIQKLLRQESWFENQRTWSQINQFFLLW